jgi:hypothetical protein
MNLGKSFTISNVYQLPIDLINAANSVQQSTQTPFEMALLILLTSVSAAYQGKYDVESLGKRELPISIALCMVAESGLGKTRLLKECHQEIDKFDRQAQETSRDGEKKYNRQMKLHKKIIHKLENNIVKMTVEGANTDAERSRLDLLYNGEPKRPISIRVKSEDATVAGIRKWLSENVPNGILVNSDAGLLLDNIIKNASVYCDLWSGSDATIVQGLKNISINNPRLSMILMVQHHHFHKHINDRNSDLNNSGLAGRFLFCEISSNLGYRTFFGAVNDNSFNMLEPYHRVVADGLRLSYDNVDFNPVSRVIIHLDESAKLQLREYAIWAENHLLPGGMFYYARDFGSRYAEQVNRLAAPIAIIRNPQNPIVSAVDIMAANGILFNYSCIHVNRYFGLMPLEQERKDGELLYAYINNVINGVLGYTYFDCRLINRTTLLQRGPRSLRNKADLDPAIRFLIDSGRLFEAGIFMNARKKITAYSLQPPPASVKDMVIKRSQRASPPGAQL